MITKNIKFGSHETKLLFELEKENLRTFTLDFQKEVKETLVRDFQGFRWLDPSSQKKVKGYSKEWGLILNLTSEELLSCFLS